MKTTKVKLIPTTLKLLLLGCMAVTFSNNSVLGYGPSEPIDSIVIGQLPPFDLPPEGGIKKPKLKNDRPQRSRRNADGRSDVDGQKYDDQDPSLDRPERPVPSKRSRPNVNGRPDVDGQPATNEQLGIPNTGGHLNGPTPIPPPPEPYKRKIIVRDYQNQGPVPHDLAHEQQNRQRSNTSRRAASGNGDGTGQCAGCGNVYSSCNCPESLLPPPPERSRPTVDGQKYDDRDPSLDPRRPERPVPSKRSRPNINGRPDVDGQPATNEQLGIPNTGGHLNGPSPIPPPPEPYKIDKHGKIRFSEHSPEKKRTVIVRDSPPPNYTRVVRPRKSN